MQAHLEEVSSTDTAPVTLGEAQNQISYFDTDRDGHIQSLINAATDWGERWTQRTLRASVTRRLSVGRWWCGELVLPWPTVSSVTSVVYDDPDGNEQTLATSNYHILEDTEGTARLVFDADADLPDLDDNPDAVRVEYVTGYQSAASVPATVKQALLLMVKTFWNQDDGRDLERAERSAKMLLSTVDWPRYA